MLGNNTLHLSSRYSVTNAMSICSQKKTRKWILQVQKKYDLEKITTHGLRHTHCSLLFKAGVSIKEVQDRLGHSDIQTTMNIYTHVTEKAKEVAAEKFAKYTEL